MISADHQRYRILIVILSTTMTLACYRQRLWNACTIIVLPNKSAWKFSDEFSKYVLQRGEFSKCVFQFWRVFLRASFPNTASGMFLPKAILHDRNPLYKAFICPHIHYVIHAFNPFLLRDSHAFKNVRKLAVMFVKGFRHFFYESEGCAYFP